MWNPNLVYFLLILLAMLARIPRNDEHTRVYWSGSVDAPRVYWHEEK